VSVNTSDIVRDEDGEVEVEGAIVLHRCSAVVKEGGSIGPLYGVVGQLVGGESPKE
jgi:hypothetical protein